MPTVAAAIIFIRMQPHLILNGALSTRNMVLSKYLNELYLHQIKNSLGIHTIDPCYLTKTEILRMLSAL